MVKIKLFIKDFFIVSLLIVLTFFAINTVFAADTDNIKLATDPSECSSQVQKRYRTPPNCLFLEEPIGGKAGYDLYTVDCLSFTTEGKSDKVCSYSIWSGGPITGNIRGPIQAVLSYEDGKEAQGPFVLLYNYIGLIYKYLSGLIIGFVVLMVIAGGIMITTSGGDTGKRDEGISLIKKSLTGMVLWFLSSLILYTINPIFFRF